MLLTLGHFRHRFSIGGAGEHILLMLRENIPEAQCFSWVEDASLERSITLLAERLKENVDMMGRQLPILQLFQLVSTWRISLKVLGARKLRSVGKVCESFFHDGNHLAEV